jgi:hypothetical protein
MGAASWAAAITIVAAGNLRGYFIHTTQQAGAVLNAQHTNRFILHASAPSAICHDRAAASMQQA